MGFIIVLDAVFMVMLFLFFAKLKAWNLWKRLSGWQNGWSNLTRGAPRDPGITSTQNYSGILEETTLFFEAALRSEWANATRYLKQRGLKSDIVKTYELATHPVRASAAAG